MDIRHRRWTSALVLLTFIGLTTSQSTAADDAETEPGRLEIKHLGQGGRVRLQVGPGRGNTLQLVPFPEDLESSSDARADNQPAAARQSTDRRSTASPDQRVYPETAAEVTHPTNASRALSGGRSSADVPLQRLPAAAMAPQSEFRPRFRSPDVRQAQHLEPVEDTVEAQTFTERRASTVEFDSVAQSATEAEPRSAAPNSPATGGKALIEAAYAQSKQAKSDAEYTEIIDLCRRASKAGLKSSHETYSQRLRSWAYNRRGETRVDQGRNQEAMADFESSVQFNAGSWRATHNRGVSYAALGRSDEAIADFDRTIEIKPDYGNAFFNRGELLYAKGKFDEAIRDYTVAVDLGPADAAMYNSRGHAYYRLQRFGDALRDYSAALELDPQYAPALVNRGDAFVDVGRYAEGAADYRSAIAADESLGRAYQAAAWLMATCPDEHYRDEKLALEAAGRAVELDGENHRNLEALAAAQANAGMFDEAKRTQERAIATVPGDQLVVAEKRMALYQRDLAYREISRQEKIVAQQEQSEADVEKKIFPVRQASADVPEDGAEAVTYPEDGTARQRPAAGEAYRMLPRGVPPGAAPKRSFWPPRLNPFNRSQQQPQQRRTLPKKPTRPQIDEAVRPW